uniref:Trichohyalin-plectin-homology domain-containing protein n=1 Tax=Mola mola TaxID=94237 RepID=A0A3Q3W2D1_MOLML
KSTAETTRGLIKWGIKTENEMMIRLPDLRQITVLSKSEWLRIQDELNQANKDKERMMEGVKQREALHLQSVEVAKQWSNTIAGQRQKKLEAKRIREEIEEEKRKLIDKEEAEYQELKQKEAIEKAKTQLYYRTDPVKGLHRALLLTEVLKEREAQIELKQRIKNTSRDAEKHFADMLRSREEEALRQEQEKVLQKKRERQAAAEDLKRQIKENELVREQEKTENKRDGEKQEELKELYQRKQRKETERQEHLANRDIVRATEAKKQEDEEKQRKHFLSAKEKMMKLRKEREAELFRWEEAQTRRENIMNKLVVTQREQTDSEEQRITKAVAERDARQAQLRREEEERRATMLKSITEHRELTRQEKEQIDKIAKQNARDALQAKEEADRIFSEKQQLKAQRIREETRKLQDFNATQMAEKSAKRQQLRRDEHQFDEMNAELIAEGENQFHQYSQQVIQAAAEAQRNVFPLYKAAREGIRGAPDPISRGVRPIYLVQDRSDAEMPHYISGVTQNTKKLNEAADIQAEKKRLGFTW